MIPCKRVAELLLSDQIASQSRWTRFQIRLHLLMCTLCSRLARQIEQISAATRQAAAQHQASPGLEERLIQRLKQK